MAADTHSVVLAAGGLGMNDTRIASGFRDTFGRRLGVAPGEAQWAARDPDAAQMILLDELDVRVFARYVQPYPKSLMRRQSTLQWRNTLDASLNGKRPTWLVVVECGGVIRSAWRLYADEHLKIDTTSPVEMLRRLAGHVGLDLRIGDLYSRFVFNQRIVLPRWTARAPIRLEQTGTQLNQWFWSLDDGPPRTAVCGLCFSIDLDAYRRYLRGEG